MLAGVNALGMGAATIPADAALRPIALIAFKYRVYTVPFVSPLTVRGELV